MHSQLPHVFVETLAVDPAHQGKGYAGLLLQAVQTLSDQDPLSQGVCLNTESASNIPFYEHMGYEVISHTHIDTLASWSLFRPDNQ